MAWFQKVSDAVARMLCACFDVDPESTEAAYRFIPAYVEDATTPQLPRTSNAVFYALSESQDTDFDYIQQRTYVAKNAVVTAITKTIPVNCMLTFYGSNADDDAEEFWSRFQLDSGYGSPRSILRQNNIVPMGNPERPVSVFEVEGTFQRRRCDVRLNLAYLETKEYQGSAVAGPPDITIEYNKKG